MSRRVDALDGLRAFSLIGIVIFHLLGFSGALTGGGELRERVIWTIFGNTLDFFFIISGFVLFMPVIRRGGDLGSVSEFYIRRFGRLQPEYWACLGVMFLLIVFVPLENVPVPGIGSILIHAFDLQQAWRMFDPFFANGFWIDGPLWMISVMAGLYLIFPLVARPFYKRIWLGLVIAAVVSACWKLLPDLLPGLMQSISGHVSTDDNLKLTAHDQAPSFFYAFTVGMAAAWLYTRASENPRSTWVRKGVPVALILAIPVFILVSIPFTNAAMGGDMAGAAGSSRGRGLILNSLLASSVRGVLVLGLALGPVWLQRPFSNRAVSWLAARSFGIYLIHMPVAFYTLLLLSLPQDGTFGSMIAWTAVVLPVATLYAACSYRFVGQPANRFVDRWIKRRRSRPNAENRVPSLRSAPSSEPKVRY